MIHRPESEFNANATPSPEMLRRLLALAIYGNESLFTVFTAMADRAGLTERGREAREKQQERYAVLRQMMMADQERVAEFQRKLDRLERETYERMLKAEEKLREARREEARVKERAHKVEIDGKMVRVYRDGDIVRDDDGNVISRDIIKAEDMPEEASKWQDRSNARNAVATVKRECEESASDYARVGAVKEAARQGNVSDDELQELEASVEPVQRRLEEAREAAGHNRVMPPHQDVSAPGPR